MLISISDIHDLAWCCRAARAMKSWVVGEGGGGGRREKVGGLGVGDRREKVGAWRGGGAGRREKVGGLGVGDRREKAKGWVVYVWGLTIHGFINLQ